MAAKKKANPGVLNTQGVIRTSLSVCDNLSETAIQVTESKARLVYQNHIQGHSGERVLSFFGLFLTFLTTNLTASFNDIWGIENSSYILCAAFWLATIGFGIATLWTCFLWLTNRKNYSEDAFIKALKGL